MPILTLSSHEFDQDTERARKAAEEGPVFIAEEGRSTHVLITIEAYEKLGGERSLLDALADWRDGGDFEFDPPRLRGPLAKPVDFS